MKRPKVKTLDLMTLGKLHKDYSGAWGLYQQEKDEIWLDKRLEKWGRPSRREVLLHEKAHRILELSGATQYLTDDQEEAFCDLWAIYKWPKKVHGWERVVKGRITAQKGAQVQIEAILRLIGKRSFKRLSGLIVAVV